MTPRPKKPPKPPLFRSPVSWARQWGWIDKKQADELRASLRRLADAVHDTSPIQDIEARTTEALRAAQHLIATYCAELDAEVTEEAWAEYERARAALAAIGHDEAEIAAAYTELALAEAAARELLKKRIHR